MVGREMDGSTDFESDELKMGETELGENTIHKHNKRERGWWETQYSRL
jgi:hypothetical protein